jgi:hypothetical protein
MFNIKPKENAGLDLVIDIAEAELVKHDIGSTEYLQIMDQLERLYKMKASVKTDPNRVSKDNLIATIGNFVGIVLVINHERVNVITSKAFNMIVRSKV